MKTLTQLPKSNKTTFIYCESGVKKYLFTGSEIVPIKKTATLDSKPDNNTDKLGEGEVFTTSSAKKIHRIVKPTEIREAMEYAGFKKEIITLLVARN